MSSSLQIGDLTVEPYEYREDSKGGALVIMAKAVLTDKQHDQLMEMQQTKDFVPVTRQGVDEEPKGMIFGMTLWSEHDTDYKHELILAELKPKPPVTEIWKNIYPVVAENKAAINSLLEMLQRKEILSAANVLEINKNINERLNKTLYELWHVKDIDEYEL